MHAAVESPTVHRAPAKEKALTTAGGPEISALSGSVTLCYEEPTRMRQGFVSQSTAPISGRHDKPKSARPILSSGTRFYLPNSNALTAFPSNAAAGRLLEPHICSG
jgi:hypothetical protein